MKDGMYYYYITAIMVKIYEKQTIVRMRGLSKYGAIRTLT